MFQRKKLLIKCPCVNEISRHDLEIEYANHQQNRILHRRVTVKPCFQKFEIKKTRKYISQKSAKKK